MVSAHIDSLLCSENVFQAHAVVPFWVKAVGYFEIPVGQNYRRTDVSSDKIEFWTRAFGVVQAL
jgi:hypothetical protein